MNNFYIKNTGGAIQKGLLNIDERLVSGYYTSDTIDMYGHVIDREGMLAAIEDYKTWGTIREMHENPIGIAASIGVPEWNFITAKISGTERGNQVLQLVNDGVYGAFSVGIIVTKAEWSPVSGFPIDSFRYLPENIRRLIMESKEVLSIKEMTLLEVSIVDRPANPAARMIDFVKSITGGAQLSVLPEIQEIRNSGMVDDVLVNPREALLITENFKRVISAKAIDTGEDYMKDTEKVVLQDDENTVEKKAEVEPAVDEGEPQEQGIEEQQVEVKNTEDATGEFDNLAHEIEAIKSIVTEIRLSVNEMIEVVKPVANYMLDRDKDDNEQEPNVVGRDESEKLKSVVEEVIKSALAEFAAQSSQATQRRLSVAPVTPDNEDKVDIKKMNARDLSRYLASIAVQRTIAGG